MNVIKAVRDYVTKMVRITQGMKVLLLDTETVSEQAHTFIETTDFNLTQ
jgi:hypothetical protein